MKKHVPILLSLLGIMSLLAWTATVRAQCLSENVTLDIPIEGSSASDQSTFSHNVGVQGSPAYVTGQDGSASGALHFNGISQYASIPANPAFEQMTNGFTIACWIHPTSAFSENAFLAKLNSSHRNFVFRFQNDGTLNFHFTRTGGLTFVVSNSPVIVQNVWQHVAATWDGSSIKLFVNGQMIKEQTITEGPTFQASGSVRLGTLNFSTERFAGYMDDVQFRSFATPDDDVACLMHSLSLSDNLVLSMPLDGDATDVSTYGNNGGINGTASAATDRFQNTTSSMSFSGNGNINIGNQAHYNALASEFTISAWIKPAVVSGNRVIIAKVGSGRDIVLRVDNGKFTAHYYEGQYFWATPPTATVVAGEWTNVVCTWDGTTMRLYQDGEEIHSTEPQLPPSFSSNNWNIGAINNSGSENFGGQIDELNIWSRALAPCEIFENIHPALDLLVEDNLNLCPGQNLIVEPIGGLCSVLWMNDNSTQFFYDIDADDLGPGEHQVVLEAYDYYDNFYSDTVNVIVSICTGINEANQSNPMKLSPNPATNVVEVSSADLAEIQLLDVSGRLLKNIAVVNTSNTMVDVSSYPSGIYFVRGIGKDGAIQTERLMKH